MHTVLLLKKRLLNFITKRVVNEQDQLYFLQRMERLLTNGYSLIETLEVIAWDRKLKQFAIKMKRTLQKGKPIDVAFEQLLFQDRKSTRLNSSHVAISYAVCCLKKKIYK